VIGVSPDSPKSHQKFKDKYELPFTLIADVDHAIAVKYGAWGQKSMFGRKYMGILRTTFVIDASGKVAKVFEKVQPMGHGEEVAKFLAVEKART
jgi:thioredoxin-dependent peroxiredoxin